MTISIPTRGRPDPRILQRQAVISALAEDRPDLAERAGLHCRPAQRSAQRWLVGVSDLDTTIVMFAVEAGWTFTRTTAAWRCSVGLPMTAPAVTAAVGELTRTGLLRDYRSPASGERVLLPAPVHLAAGGLSACLFVGEDLGPMRARLTEDLGLVDCSACLAVA